MTDRVYGKLNNWTTPEFISSWASFTQDRKETKGFWNMVSLAEVLLHRVQKKVQEFLKFESRRFQSVKIRLVLPHGGLKV